MWLQPAAATGCAACSGLCRRLVRRPARRRRFIAARRRPRTSPRGWSTFFNGGGVAASGPALLVRKSIADTVSLTGTLYVDMVSNASIDVVTTASPFRETRGPPTAWA